MNGSKRLFTWRSQTFQLATLLLLLLVGILLLITFGSAALHEDAMRQMAAERDEQTARAASAAVEGAVRARADLLDMLAARMAAGNMPSEEDARASFDVGVGVVSASGELLAFEGDEGAWEALRPSAVQRLAQPGGSLLIAGPERLPGYDSPVMALLRRVPGQDQYAAGVLSVDSLAAQVLSGVLTDGRSAAFMLQDAQGLPLYQTGPSAFVSSHDMAGGPIEASQSGARFEDAEGTEYLVAYSQVASTGWVVVMEEHWEHVMSPLLRTTQLAPLVMAPVALLALVALWFGVRQIVNPLRQLAAQASHIGWGDYEAIERPVGGISEIQQLQKELVYISHKVQAAQRSLHGYIGAITTGQEEERRRLARELHDDTVQSLIALKQRVQLLQLDMGELPHSKALADLESAAEQTINNLRLMIRDLRPIYLEDLGLTAALEMLVREAGQTCGAEIDFQRQGQERRLEAPVELSLYRIAQEALSNIVRHSAATRAQVRIAFTPEAVQVEVEDNGRGFSVPKSPAEFVPAGHFGLLGMQERADLVGATLVVNSRAGEGTRLVVRLPNDGESG